MHTKCRRYAYRRMPSAYAFLGGLFILIGGMSSLFPTALHPEQIGPYLNGIFPQQTPGDGESGNWTLVNAYPNLVFADPLSIIQIPDTSGFYVTGKQGFIWKISNDTTTIESTILDISNVVDTDGDAGLINNGKDIKKPHPK